MGKHCCPTTQKDLLPLQLPAQSLLCGFPSPPISRRAKLCLKRPDSLRRPAPGQLEARTQPARRMANTNLGDILQLHKGLLLPTQLTACQLATHSHLPFYPLCSFLGVLAFPTPWVSPALPPFQPALPCLPKSQPGAARCRHQPTPGPRSPAAASPGSHDAFLLQEPARCRASSQSLSTETCSRFPDVRGWERRCFRWRQRSPAAPLAGPPAGEATAALACLDSSHLLTPLLGKREDAGFPRGHSTAASSARNLPSCLLSLQRGFPLGIHVIHFLCLWLIPA